MYCLAALRCLWAQAEEVVGLSVRADWSAVAGLWAQEDLSVRVGS